MTNAKFQKEWDKAIMRLRNIENKFAGDEDKIYQHILLRADRMTKLPKLKIWKKILWQMGHRKAANMIMVDM